MDKSSQDKQQSKRVFYSVTPQTTPLPSQEAKPKTTHKAKHTQENPYLRAENEDDDGYDPYSDRPAAGEPAFEEDPWA